MQSNSQYGIVILAAGNSSRLGEPKQLLKYQDKTLICHIAEAAVEAASREVVVVTGSGATLIEKELEPLTFHQAFNANWEMGMGSSVAAGIAKLLEVNPLGKGAIIAVSDQPFVTSDLFNALFQKSEETGAGIAACAYDDTIGTPVFFSKKYFDILLKLNGADGAKKLLKKYESDVTTVSFPAGSIDIDTAADYQKLLKSGLIN
ncbi:nucleotidyltransferase family protein [Dyadobacter flavalbus]|uniref:Nucleotidyltransferase family protein n=2 Tax=Dyadobacter flavalbus TaxID=2579942 RepID=A0A5M8QV85_9BACT|nr:nucleotidyltransferase family protein [Dyadobacter flavalbus]